MELARSNTEKHSEVAVGLGSLLLKFNDSLDVLELGLGPALVLTSLTTEAAKDVSRFLVATDLAQPTRRLGEEPDNAQKDEERNDLEGNRESPSESGSATIDEGETAVNPLIKCP